MDCLNFFYDAEFLILNIIYVDIIWEYFFDYTLGLVSTLRNVFH